MTSKIQYCLVKCMLFKWSIDETNKNSPTTFNKLKSTIYSFIDNLSQAINYLDSQQTIEILIHSEKYQLKIIYSFCTQFCSRNMNNLELEIHCTK